ncbi:hypothetical protein GGR51DRAFT_530230 [Nemania sp. FL0031]|nr:hypothetical protein GGR51DRAFT_530230 [Nemania sp. FL0031]
MLLTSSQVSVLITTGMVLLCTSALFISGCLIQQRTLRDLRSAIRPAVVTRPKPRYWDVEAMQRQRREGVKTRIKLEDGTLVEIQGPSADVEPVEPVALELGTEMTDGEQEGEIVEVQLTPRDAEELELGQKQAEPSPGSGGENESRENEAVDTAAAPAWDGVQEGGEPLSRAERRRRIKAEIQRLSHGDTPVYYQRRLW